jgi:hypothetical protein
MAAPFDGSKGGRAHFSAAARFGNADRKQAEK